MTRQKKELFKKLEEIDFTIRMNECFGCSPSERFYDEMEERRREIYQKLAKLTGFDNVEDYLYGSKSPLFQY